MEELIKEGSLRLLMSESSCDVILSCGGYRLMAHKVILSIASPVLQELLRHEDAVPTVIIFPDISENTMSLILDYIYSGSINIRSDVLSEFIAVANELKLQVDTDNFKLAKYFRDPIEEKIKPDFKFSVDKKEDIKSVTDDGNHKVQKCVRKMPGLLPLTKLKRKKVLHNSITPSPWAPRVTPLLANPLENHLHAMISHHVKQNLQRNDKNNNRQVQDIIKTTPPFRDQSPENNKRIDSQCSRILSHTAADSHQTNLILSNSSDTNGIDTINQSLNLMDEKKTCADLKQNDVTNLSKQAAHIKINTKKVVDKTTIEKIFKTSRLTSDTSNSKQTDNKKYFSCEDCGKSFSQLRNFKYHRSIHEGTKEFSARCPECGKMFNDKGYLSSHMKIHRDRKEYACPQCPKRFNQRVAYNMHLRIHTGLKPHECPTCGKTFSRKMLLKQHQRVHTGERPYSCPECGKSFADRSNMSLHARLHTGVKPYTCNLCSKSFTKKHHLKTHMNFHTGLKPYSCEKCGLAFSQSSNMRTHYKRCILKAKDIPDSENT